jgi:hypothetical protein
MTDEEGGPEQRGEAFEQNIEEEENESSSGRVGRASNLTGMVDTTMESQASREQTARSTIEGWEREASEETGRLVDEYEELQEEAEGAVAWTLSLDTEVSELVDDLEYGEDLELSDYGERQSEQVEGLTGSRRKWASTIEAKEQEISDRRDRIDELEEERREGYEDVDSQIEDMDEEELPGDMDWSDLQDSEYDGVDSEFDRLVEEVEEEIEELQDRKGRAVNRKKAAASERSTRREEAQLVYNAVAGEAERVITENTGKLRQSLGVLRELETQEEIYTSESVENGVIDQRQDDQAESRSEAAMAYVAEALSQTEELEAAVRDHDRLKNSFSDPVQVETRELQSIYEDLADPEAVEEDIEEDEYGINVLRQRILEAAETISDDGYDSIRELRELAEEQDNYDAQA